MKPATINVETAAEMLGISRGSAYEAARTGEIAGCAVIRVGRRLVIPRAPFEAALGITTTTQESSDDAVTIQ